MYCACVTKYEQIDQNEVRAGCAGAWSGGVTGARQLLELFQAAVSAGGGDASSLPAFALPSQDGCARPVYGPVCLAIVSHYPFFSVFRVALCQLLRISITPDACPLEACIAHLVYDVPLPPAGDVSVGFRLADVEVVFARPPADDLPYLGTPLKVLFQCLDADRVLEVFTAAILQAKIALCSSQVCGAQASRL